MAEHEEQKLSVPMAIVGMVNGMIGGLILLLPVYALDAGYILTLIIIFITCVFSYYSCYLCLIHMGDQPDLDFAILRHFNGNKYVKIAYDLCVWSNLMLIDLLYFQLIIIQWIGLIPPHQFSWINAVVNAFILLCLVFVLKYFEFGASLMAYGIISIVTYILFLLWVVITYNQGYEGGPPMKPFGSGAVNLAAAMGQAFSIQSFFIPVIKKAPNPSKYTFYTLIAYITGGLAYYYIAYAGSVGIWKREYQGQPGGQQTIEGYFAPGKWEVNIIEGIYLIHLYSVFPQFLLISKRRMFGVIGLEESEKGKIKISQIIYVVIIVGICLAVGLVQVNVSDIIDINGAVIGFFFIYLIPAILHLKCLYFSRGKRPLPDQPQHELRPSSSSLALQGEDREQKQERQKRTTDIEITGLAFVQSDKRQVRSQKSASIGIKEPLIGIKQESQSQQNVPGHKLTFGSIGNNSFQKSSSVAAIQYAQQCSAHYYCNVSLETYSRKALVLDWTFIIIMVGLGLFIMLNGIYTVAK